jgi:hypothetical protein
MAMTITPSSISNAKKNSYYNVLYVPAGGVAPYSWVLTSGALPTWLSFTTVNIPVGTGSVTCLNIFGYVPNALATGVLAPLFTCTDSTPTTHLTATVTTSTGGTIVSGPDPEGYHDTEANRSEIVTVDQFRRGISGADNTGTVNTMTTADYIARAWPLDPPSQNS